MALTELPDDHRVEIVEIEPVRIRVLPDGRMDRKNAAKYLNRKSKTLAMWAMSGTGPPVHKVQGRCFYFKEDLDRLIRGDAVVEPAPA